MHRVSMFIIKLGSAYSWGAGVAPSNLLLYF